MHAFILVTNSQQQALKKITKILKGHGKVQPWHPPRLDLAGIKIPDIVLIKPENSITIAQIRELKKLLSRKPIKLSVQAGIIFQSELMTLPAQNAFLKLLEEPTKNTLLFLITKNAESLLPTIRSRCQIIRLIIKKPEIDTKTVQKTLKFLKQLKNANPGQRLNLIEPITKSREEAIKFCQDTIYILQAQLPNKPCKDGPCWPARTVLVELKTLLRATQQALTDLENNINVKLVIDNWALDLNESQTSSSPSWPTENTGEKNLANKVSVN